MAEEFNLHEAQQEAELNPDADHVSEEDVDHYLFSNQTTPHGNFNIVWVGARIGDDGQKTKIGRHHLWIGTCSTSSAERKAKMAEYSSALDAERNKSMEKNGNPILDRKQLDSLNKLLPYVYLTMTKKGVLTFANTQQALPAMIQPLSPERVEYITNAAFPPFVRIFYKDHCKYYKKDKSFATQVPQICPRMALKLANDRARKELNAAKEAEETLDLNANNPLSLSATITATPTPVKKKPINVVKPRPVLSEPEPPKEPPKEVSAPPEEVVKAPAKEIPKTPEPAKAPTKAPRKQPNPKPVAEQPVAASEALRAKVLSAMGLRDTSEMEEDDDDNESLGSKRSEDEDEDEKSDPETLFRPEDLPESEEEEDEYDEDEEEVEAERTGGGDVQYGGEDEEMGCDDGSMGESEKNELNESEHNGPIPTVYGTLAVLNPHAMHPMVQGYFTAPLEERQQVPEKFLTKDDKKPGLPLGKRLVGRGSVFKKHVKYPKVLDLSMLKGVEPFEPQQDKIKKKAAAEPKGTPKKTPAAASKKETTPKKSPAKKEEAAAASTPAKKSKSKSKRKREELPEEPSDTSFIYRTQQRILERAQAQMGNKKLTLPEVMVAKRGTVALPAFATHQDLSKIKELSTLDQQRVSEGLGMIVHFIEEHERFIRKPLEEKIEKLRRKLKKRKTESTEKKAEETNGTAFSFDF